MSGSCRQHRAIRFALLLVCIAYGSAVWAATDCSSMFHGNPQHTGVCSTDVKDMKLLWKFHTDNMVRSTPAVVDGTVYVGGNDRHVYALDRRTGKLLWKHQTDTSAPYPMTGVFIGSPTIAADMGLVFAGCRDGHLYAFDLATGRLRWRLDEHGSWVVSTPAYENGIVYATTSDTRLVEAVDARTGRILWQQQSYGYVFPSPVVTPRAVYAASWGAVVGQYNKANGQLIGGNGGEGPFLSSPAIAHGVLFIGCDDWNIYAFD